MSRSMIFLFNLFFLVCAQNLLYAQRPPAPERMREELSRMEQEAQRMRKQQLEFLKKEDPNAYASQKAAMDRQAAINNIMDGFTQGKISKSAARSQLGPLIREEVSGEAGGLDARIRSLENQLNFLKKARQNPDLMAQKRIDQLLGDKQAVPEPPLY